MSQEYVFWYYTPMALQFTRQLDPIAVVYDCMDELSAFRGAPRALTHEWTDVIERDSSHPCIVAWVPFNESWGVPDLPAIAAQRHYVQALYHRTRTLDPPRPVVGNDGWESVAAALSAGVRRRDRGPRGQGGRLHPVRRRGQEPR